MSPLRDLLREDADWNLLLRDVTERSSTAAEEITEFDTSFNRGPDEVSTPSLKPKMSAIAHRAPITDLSGTDRVDAGRGRMGAAHHWIFHPGGAARGATSSPVSQWGTVADLVWREL
ncbi:hypothetical protein [Lentzea sp. E54]|uniref:hypothetical protein n=1 Tax=Lentzea xerophila TaxID=3435883 RepID=UPI003DA5B3C3